MNGTSNAVRPAFAVRKIVWPSRIPRNVRWPATYWKPASGLSTRSAFACRWVRTVAMIAADNK